jgi:hypothetical protein
VIGMAPITGAELFLRSWVRGTEEKVREREGEKARGREGGEKKGRNEGRKVRVEGGKNHRNKMRWR